MIYNWHFDTSRPWCILTLPWKKTQLADTIRKQMVTKILYLICQSLCFSCILPSHSWGHYMKEFCCASANQSRSLQFFLKNIIYYFVIFSMFYCIWVDCLCNFITHEKCFDNYMARIDVNNEIFTIDCFSRDTKKWLGNRSIHIFHSLL